MPGKIEDKRKGGNRGWNGWMASPIQWTWTLANSRRWWGIGKPGVLQSMGSQRVGLDWVTELNLTEYTLVHNKEETQKIAVYTRFDYLQYITINRAFYKQFSIGLESFQGWLILVSRNITNPLLLGWQKAFIVAIEYFKLNVFKSEFSVILHCNQCFLRKVI